MSEAEASFDPHAPVSNVAVSVLSRQPPFAGPAGLEAGNGEGGLVTPETGAVVAASFDAAESEPESALLDIGIASFGEGLIPEAVIGSDDRLQVTDTQSYLWRAIASLRITARDGSQWIGTAWFISPRTLVTAGHCVCIKGSGDPDRDGWVTSIDVMPGRNGSSRPFGTLKATTFWSVRGWTEKGDQNQDYAAILLDEPFGIQTGWFGYAVYPDDRLVNVPANVAGYPGDKPPGTLWHHALPIASVGPEKVFYAIDTAGGQSGTAVYLLEDGQPVSVAVHAYGGSVSNSGTRISAPVYRNLRQWSA